MANSCRRNPLGLDPFENGGRTPGPLGHNDAVDLACEAFRGLGDTPGPLGINDHADPVKAMSPKANPNVIDKLFPLHLKISEKGLRFIWGEEYVRGISERLHWPGGASGVTLGAGYDMKARSKESVAGNLQKIGVNAEVAKKVAEGAGLAGIKAKQFVAANRNLIVITDEQATMLLNMIIGGYEEIVKLWVKVKLQQHEFDALVSFAYNPGGRFKRVATLINGENITGAMQEIKAANTSGGRVLDVLVRRREHEVNLFVYGKYM